MTSTTDRAAARVSRLDPLYSEVHDWLDDEAQLLDNSQLDEWLARLDEGLSYLLPVRQTVYRDAGDGVSATGAHFDESYASMRFKVERMNKNGAWSENPRSRTRRFVTNVRVSTAGDSDVHVESYLLLLRSRGDVAHFDFVSCLRSDVLRRSESGQLKLLRRVITVDQSTLGTANLAIFI